MRYGQLEEALKAHKPSRARGSDPVTAGMLQDCFRTEVGAAYAGLGQTPVLPEGATGFYLVHLKTPLVEGNPAGRAADVIEDLVLPNDGIFGPGSTFPHNHLELLIAEMNAHGGGGFERGPSQLSPFPVIRIARADADALAEALSVYPEIFGLLQQVAKAHGKEPTAPPAHTPARVRVEIEEPALV